MAEWPMDFGVFCTVDAVDELGMIPRTSWIEPEDLILESVAATGRDVLADFG